MLNNGFINTDECTDNKYNIQIEMKYFGMWFSNITHDCLTKREIITSFVFSFMKQNQK